MKNSFSIFVNLQYLYIFSFYLLTKMANLKPRKVVKESRKTYNESFPPPVRRKIYFRNDHIQSISEYMQIDNRSSLEENIKSCVKQMQKLLENKDHKKVLHLGQAAISLFASMRQNDLNKRDILCLQGSMFMLLCKSQIETNNYSTVIEYAPALIDIAHKIDDSEFTIDVNNIIAQAYILAKDYHNAAASWQRNLNCARNQTEKAFFYHEIGRCCYQMTQFSEARLFGLWSLTEAFAASNNWWCLNAALLIAQSETLMGCNQEALESFIEAEKYACREKKQDIIDYIGNQKAMFLETIKTSQNTIK